jgi:hypothetical protein
MKKLFVTGGVALLSFGLYAGLMNNGNSYVHEDYSSITDAPYQDTMPKKKKDKKKKKDTMYVAINPAATQLAAR